MEWLTRYDPLATRRDFTRIAGAGMDTVRIFLRWQDLQPAATRIDPAALAAILDTADAASEAAVDLIVTLFTGHMSGVNWIPTWAIGGHDGDDRFRVVCDGVVQPRRRVLRSWYSDEGIVDSQVLLADHVASALTGHPAVWAWDLGNENSNCTIPPGPSAADRWLERISSVLRARDPRVRITIGTHMEDIENDRLIGPTEAGRWCDFVSMHGYPAYADWSRGATDEQLVPFLAELTAWLAGDAPVLFSEFGQSTVAGGEHPAGLRVSEVDAGSYTAATLDALLECGSRGALIWCYTDYEARLHHHPPFDHAVHERTFGLWRANGTPKPAVAEISTRTGRSCQNPKRTRPWLDVTIDEFAANRPYHLARLYRRYVDSFR